MSWLDKSPLAVRLKASFSPRIQRQQFRTRFPHGSWYVVCCAGAVCCLVHGCKGFFYPEDVGGMCLRNTDNHQNHMVWHPRRTESGNSYVLPGLISNKQLVSHIKGRTEIDLPGSLKNTVLQTLFVSRRDEVSGGSRKCIIRRSIVCVLHQVLLLYTPWLYRPWRTSATSHAGRFLNLRYLVGRMACTHTGQHNTQRSGQTYISSRIRNHAPDLVVIATGVNEDCYIKRRSQFKTHQYPSAACIMVVGSSLSFGV
jgi:hypothetical protein